MKTSNLVLTLIGILTVIFTIEMIYIFRTQYSIPDTLVTCWFTSVVGECGVLGWIKTSKVRHQEHDWEVEAYERYKKDAEENK